MKMKSLGKAFLGLLLSSILMPIPAQAEQTAPQGGFVQAQIQEKEAREIAVDAYIYGYPLVTMEMTRRVMTNVAKPTGRRAPMGQFANMRQVPPPDFHDVTTPNADTLYSSAWLNLAKEPYILSLPNEYGRYYMMPMLSGWTDVFQVPGTRTTGTKAQKYAITGPNWQGKLPAGVVQYKAPTNMVWIIGRTYSKGTQADYCAVHQIQNQYRVVPLSAYGKCHYYAPRGKVDTRVDMKTSVRDQVNAMDAGTYFKLLASLLKDNPPAQEDAPMVAKLAQIGIVPGQEFDIQKLDSIVAKGLQSAPQIAREKIIASLKTIPKVVNGWGILPNTGNYGTKYLDRALVAAFGLGANRPQDAVYPISVADAQGQRYDGANKYVLHFDKGQLPPVKGFWSLTMYNDQFFFVKNPLNRYSLSQRNKLTYNKDGSVDLYIQNTSPGKDKVANWLPAPKGNFALVMRLYWPEESPQQSILDGSWQPPPVQIVK